MSLAEVDTLHGLLQHCASGLLKGRFHLAFTVSARSQALRLGFAIMHPEWSFELGWWSSLLQQWNRIALLIPLKWVDPALSPNGSATKRAAMVTIHMTTAIEPATWTVGHDRA